MSIQSRRWTMMALIALLIVSSFIARTPRAFATTGDTTTRVSVTSSLGQSNYGTMDMYEAPALSGDGKVVAFVSSSTNIVTPDNSGNDLFVYDSNTNPATVTRITSINGSGVSKPVLSESGRYVAFQADGALLGTTTGYSEVYWYDRTTSTLRYASIDGSGNRGTSAAYVPSISGDGRYVVFQTPANLSSGDTANEDIYQYDSTTNATTLISKNTSGTKGNSDSREPNISSNGRYITYYSTSTNLDAADTNTRNDVYVYDRVNGTTILASRATDVGNAGSGPSTVSDNGRVAFLSSSTNLASQCSSGYSCAFVRDTINNTTRSVSNYNITDGTPDINKWGNFVVFMTNQSGIVSNDSNSYYDVFRFNLAQDTVIRVSEDGSGNGANNQSWYPVMSDDGLRVAYQSRGTNLIGSGNDTNGEQDTFLSYVQWDAPSWWKKTVNGVEVYDECYSQYYNAHKSSSSYDDAYALSTTGWNGIIPCGPRPYYQPSSPNPDVAFPSTQPLYGDFMWECTELAKRYLYIAYGLPRQPGSGYQVASKYYDVYSNTLALDHIIATGSGSTRTVSEFPKVGSVVSYYTNHVAIVTNVQIGTGTGNATITVMEQNISTTGFATDTISGWEYSAHSGLYTKDWITPK